MGAKESFWTKIKGIAALITLLIMVLVHTSTISGKIARIEAKTEGISTKVDKEYIDQIERRLDRIEKKIDRLIERKN